MNAKIQGNVGIGQAIAYFTSLNFIVSVPLTDSQKYDLIVDDGKLWRVQVKTSRYRQYKAFLVQLKQSGGTRKAATSTRFDPKSCDLVFVYCSDGSRYLIPSAAVTTTTTLSLGPKYQEYRLA
jgi:PD-(D/E)XK endonuclease